MNTPLLNSLNRTAGTPLRTACLTALFAVLAAVSFSCAAPRPLVPDLVPYPAEVTAAAGPEVVISADSPVRRPRVLAEVLDPVLSDMRQTTGFPLHIEDGEDDTGEIPRAEAAGTVVSPRGFAGIEFRLVASPAPWAGQNTDTARSVQNDDRIRAAVDEGYRLTVSRDLILVEATGSAGALYGLTTLRQLMRNTQTLPSIPLSLTPLRIVDYPRFVWRGSMLDSVRHFIPVEYIMRHLDLMAEMKLNVFHWHLTDDQGWRIEIKGWPKLTTVGAWRKDSDSGGRYGGYYSADDIRTIVAKAARLNITVVPEIDVPGHSGAAVASYPKELGNSGPGAPVAGEVPVSWVGTVTLCPGKDSSLRFVADVVDAFAALFPGPYVHLGGDEVPAISAWSECPECIAKMKALGLDTVEDLEAWFNGQVRDIVRAKGKIPIQWNDSFSAQSHSEGMFQYWREDPKYAHMAGPGTGFVLSPATYTYLDMSYHEPQPRSWAGYIGLSRVYDLEPGLFGLDENQVTGIEAPLWTEHTSTAREMDVRIWPRLMAIAEAAWTPKALRSWKSFGKRLPWAIKILSESGASFYRTPEIEWDPSD